MTRKLAAIVTLLMLTATFALAAAPGEDTRNVVAGVQREGAPGIFKAKCASCHGPDGAGATAVGKAMKVRDLRSAEVQKQSDTDRQLHDPYARSRYERCSQQAAQQHRDR